MSLDIAAATQDASAALEGRRGYRGDAAPLCLVSHDAYRHGAQILALDLARTFARVFGIELHIILLGPGPLTAQFRRYGRVHVISPDDRDMTKCAADLAARGVHRAIVNSAASGLMVERLARVGIRSTALVHELPALIGERALAAHVEAIRAGADTIVFPSDYVRDRFPGGAPDNARVLPQGLARRTGAPAAATRAAARQMLMGRFGIPLDAPVVMNAGYGDLRKGIDLFVDIGAAVMSQAPAAHFVWVGAIEPAQTEMLRRKLEASGVANRFTFAPFTDDLASFLAAADLFALTSREDPFPTVLLEAQDAGVAAVAFAGAGGFEALLRQGGGELAIAGDTVDFASRLLALLNAPARREEMSTAATLAVSHNYNLRSYAFELVALANAAPPRISVIVPNRNYARHLPERLRTILNQTAPIYELIVLDDCSTDDSIAVAHAALRPTEIDWRVVDGTEKAASVFQQWRRGVAMARGEFVWIAEADDLSDPRFLETAMSAFKDTSVILSYTQSRQVDENGRTVDRDYLAYVSAIDNARWRAAYVNSGPREIVDALAVKNTIPNVSACVFRKEAMRETLERYADEIERYRVAGDWMAYVRLLARGKIAFDARALNLHRRHARSVTASALSAEASLREITEIQALVAKENTLSPRIAALQAAYREELRAQFGLNLPT